MANITTFCPPIATYGAGHTSQFGHQALHLFRRDIDVTNTDKWGVTATTWASGNTIEMCRLPVGTMVIAGGMEIIRAETVTPTCNIQWGTVADPDAWALNDSNDTAGTQTSIVTTNATNVFLLVNTAETAIITLDTAALTNCYFAVWLLMAQVGQYAELS